jgi:hypothetical protein
MLSKIRIGLGLMLFLPKVTAWQFFAMLYGFVLDEFLV